MRALLIVNPNATATTPAGRDLLAYALSSRVSLTVAHTTHRGHAAELAKAARDEGMGLIIAHGGDGTVNEVVNGVLGPPTLRFMPATTFGFLPPVAVVPGGSANVFARSLGMSPDPVEATNQLIDLLDRRKRRKIGLGHCDNRWFILNAGLGLDAQVCEAIDTNRQAGKSVTPASYVRHSIRAFFRAKGAAPALSVELPGRDPIEGVHYVFISNSSPWTYLNKRPVHTNPGTSFDTGLGLFAMTSTNLLPSLRVARQLLATRAEPKSRKLIRIDDLPRIRIRSQRPIDFQMDGDYIGLRSTVEFTSVPNALDLIAPPRR